MFHVELRQFPNVTHAFNLTAEELEARIVDPWIRGVPLELNERQWAPERAKIKIYEGAQLRPEDIGMGRGWQNARRGAEDVTDRVLAAGERVGPFKEVLCAERQVTLQEVLSLAHQRFPDRRISERFALAEQAVWELLHEGKLEMARGAQVVPHEEWQGVLLAWSAWVDEKQLVLIRR